jgi:hypothetical protein
MSVSNIRENRDPFFRSFQVRETSAQCARWSFVCSINIIVIIVHEHVNSARTIAFAAIANLNFTVRVIFFSLFYIV